MRRRGGRCFVFSDVSLSFISGGVGGAADTAPLGPLNIHRVVARVSLMYMDRCRFYRRREDPRRPHDALFNADRRSDRTGRGTGVGAGAARHTTQRGTRHPAPRRSAGPEGGRTTRSDAHHVRTRLRWTVDGPRTALLWLRSSTGRIY